MSGTHIWLPLLLVLTFVFLTASEIRRATDSSVFILDDAMSAMMEVSLEDPICRMYTNRGGIQRMLLQADPRRIHLVPRDSFIELERACRISWASIKAWFTIFPRTKWCGAGNIASDFNDLGSSTEEDRCCREHDHCPKVLNVGECRPGTVGQVCNKKVPFAYTISHCDCDAQFRHCLQSLNTATAKMIDFAFRVAVRNCLQEPSPCVANQKPTECAIEIKRKPFWRADAQPLFPPQKQLSPWQYAIRQNGYPYQNSASEDNFWMD